MIDIQAEIARIDRQRQEIHKPSKNGDDMWILAFAALIAVFGSILAAIIARLPELLAAFGVSH